MSNKYLEKIAEFDKEAMLKNVAKKLRNKVKKSKPEPARKLTKEWPLVHSHKPGHHLYPLVKRLSKD